LSDQYLNNMRDALKGGDPAAGEETDRRVANLLRPLSEVETQAGSLNVLDALKSAESSWRLKRELYEHQLRPALEWLKRKDIEKLREEALEREEMPSPPESDTEDGEGDEQESDGADGERTEGGEDDTGESGEKEQGGTDGGHEAGEGKAENTPPDDDETASSMESGVEGREGPPGAHFSITPYRGGYVRRRVYYGVNQETGRWLGADGAHAQLEREPMDEREARVLYGVVPSGKRVSIPLYYNWTVDPASLQSTQSALELSRDSEGQWFLQNTGGEDERYTLTIAPRRSDEQEESTTRSAELSGELVSELTHKLQEITQEHRAPMRQAREIAKYVHESLSYSNEPEAWQEYRAEPARFFERLWQRGEADCFVANMLCTRLLTEAGLTARMAGGYYIQEKGENGEAVMHNGNGHGWCEVYDKESRKWVRLDATPGGDPTMDQDKQEQELSGEEGAGTESEGDRGEEKGGEGSDELLSEEELEDQLKELEEQKEGTDSKERRERTPRHSREVDQFAGQAEVDPTRAEAFLKALERVRAITDSEGVPITERLIEQWKRIVEERRTEVSEYQGPVRMDEGERLEDPVSAGLDLRSGEPNPTGFERDEIVEKKESDFGGLDIYFSFDLSGSMNQPDPESGRRQADVQRDAALLFADSLMQCATLSRKAGSDKLPIKLMATLASAHGEVSLPLTADWNPKQQVQFFESLDRPAEGGTPTHETLEHINEALTSEQEELDKKRTPEHKRPLHYVVELTDGLPNDPDATRMMHEQLKENGAVVRSYLVGAQATAADAETVDSFERIPEILATDIVEQFKKLQPRRVR
jgi:transglutaminase-like putative cysteine protease